MKALLNLPRMHFKAFVLIALLWLCVPATAQEKPKDSAKLYRNIEKFSKKRKFTKFIHGLIFEPIQAKKAVAKKKPKVPQKKRRSYEGKIIRNINIETLDPFGFSDRDPTREPKRYWEKVGNKLHMKTRQIAIKNLLLFKRNKPFDSLVVQESERLIRAQRYVRSVVIEPIAISGKSDSVDVNIRVLDSWSLIPDLAISSNNTRIDLTERNFLGTGHQFEHRYEKEFDTGDDAYSTRYTVPNILNTYIRTSLAYEIDLERDYRKSLNIERPFFSPFTRWAAGIYLDQRFQVDSLQDAALNYERQNFKTNTQDYWAGHSFRIFKGNTERYRQTNLITTARFLKVDFREAPELAYDTIGFYSDEKFYLVGIGVSSRQFVEDRFIFNYGTVEDVPVGRAFGLTGGWQEKNDFGRLDLGARVSIGQYYRIGYFSSNFEYGTFLSNSVAQQSAFTVQGNYFTNLLEAGRWKFRHFVKGRAVIGNGRQASNGDLLTLNENPSGISGFDAREMFGDKKLLFTWQTQVYAPWNFIGFRLNPYFNYSVGFLGKRGGTIFDSKAYSKIGAGLIISNDYLVFSTFQISLAYYPVLPGSGENIFRMNAFSTSDFGYQNFDLAKPRTVDYE